MLCFKLRQDASSKSSLKSEERAAVDLAKETATTLLQLAREVADPFPPLKAVAAGILFIVERIEVSICARKTLSEYLKAR